MEDIETLSQPGTEPTEAPQPEPAPVEEPVSAEELLGGADTIAAADTAEEMRLRAVLEAIVYVTEEPLTLQQIAAALETPLERVRPVLDQLVAEYEKPEHGLTIKEVAGGYKMATKPEHHEAVRNFVKSLKPPLKLSLAALETLAVIAYKQPVTAPEIMEIRGVQGAGVLKTLLDRKLIAGAGRKNVIGKPILYKTTKEFLVQFGLKDLSELPTLKEFEEIGRMALGESEPAEAPAGLAQAGEAPAPVQAAVEAQPEDPDATATAVKGDAADATQTEQAEAAVQVQPEDPEAPAIQVEADAGESAVQAQPEDPEAPAPPAEGDAAECAVELQPEDPEAPPTPATEPTPSEGPEPPVADPPAEEPQS